MKLYENLALELENQIRSGSLRYGERLPSIRAQSDAHGLSPGTVVEAYAWLEERGLIEPRPRSGYFVTAPRVDTPTPESDVESVYLPPEDPSPEELIHALRQAIYDPKILPLGIATPAAEFFPNAQVDRILKKVLREEPTTLSDYIYPPGTIAFRRAISSRYRKLHVESEWKDAISTSGATESIGLALRAVANPGDVVLLESPTYFGIIQLVRTMGYGIYEAPLHPTNGLDPEELLRAKRKIGSRLKAAVLVPNHSNPLGLAMSDDRKKELVLAAQKTGITLIEDEVYADLSFADRRPKPLKAFDPDDSVILCGSFSKTISPSVRAGYLLNSRHHEALFAQKSTVSSGVSTLAEETLALFLKDGFYERHLARVTREYQRLLGLYTSTIIQSFPDGTRVSRPAGGYVLWVQLPGEIDSRLLQRRALEKRINIASGVLFSPQGAFQSCIRMNFAFPFTPQIERGIRTLGALAME